MQLALSSNPAFEHWCPDNPLSLPLRSFGAEHVPPSRGKALQTRPNILILMGVTGSGKTTIGHLLSADVGWKYLDADDFHPTPNIEKMKRGIPLNDSDREPWLLRLREVINNYLEANAPAVLSCSALKQSYRNLLMIDGRVRFVYLKGSSQLIEQRLRNRSGHYMHPRLLQSQFDALEEPSECLQIDISKPPREIVTLIKKHFRLETSGHE